MESETSDYVELFDRSIHRRNSMYRLNPIRLMKSAKSLNAVEDVTHRLIIFETDKCLNLGKQFDVGQQRNNLNAISTCGRKSVSCDQNVIRFGRNASRCPGTSIILSDIFAGGSRKMTTFYLIFSRK